MENHHVLWGNPLYMAIFNSFLYVYQRVHTKSIVSNKSWLVFSIPYGWNYHPPLVIAETWSQKEDLGEQVVRPLFDCSHTPRMSCDL